MPMIAITSPETKAPADAFAATCGWIATSSSENDDDIHDIDDIDDNLQPRNSG